MGQKVEIKAAEPGIMLVERLFLFLYYRLILSLYLREYLPNDSLTRNFLDYEGKQIVMPEKFPPDTEFMQMHREEVFLQS